VVVATYHDPGLVILDNYRYKVRGITFTGIAQYVGAFSNEVEVIPDFP
jgi:hypothetical protein